MTDGRLKLLVVDSLFLKDSCFTLYDIHSIDFRNPRKFAVCVSLTYSLFFFLCSSSMFLFFVLFSSTNMPLENTENTHGDFEVLYFISSPL